MTDSSKIHVIIINWNGIQDTIECVNSIARQNLVSPKIHLWDNNSNNREICQIKTTLGSDNIIYYDSPTNLGYTKATNSILSKILLQGDSGPEYIALINNDTILDPNWLRNITAFAREHKADVISSRMLSYHERNVIDNLGHKMLRTGEIIPVMSDNDTSADYSNFGACAGGALIATSCLREIGTFDTYFDTGYEDAEFGFRALMYGYKTVHCDTALIYHKGGASIKKIYDENYAIKVQKDILFTICKLYPPLLLVLILPITLIRNLVMGLAAMLMGKFNYLKILVKATFKFLQKDLKVALNARKQLKPRKRAINSVQLLSMQRSSLIFDLKRVIKYLVLRKKSSLDQYR